MVKKSGGAREPGKGVKYPARLLPERMPRHGRIKDFAVALGIKRVNQRVDLSVSAMLRVIEVAKRRARTAKGAKPEALAAIRRGGRKGGAVRKKQMARERRQKMEEARQRRIAEGPGFKGDTVWQTGRDWPAALDAVRLIPDGPFRIRRRTTAVTAAVAAGFLVEVWSGHGKSDRIVNPMSGARGSVPSLYRITPLGRRAREWAMWCHMRWQAGYPAPAHGVALGFAHVVAWIEGGDVVPQAAGGRKGPILTAGYGSGAWCDAPWPGAGAGAGGFSRG